MPAGPSLPASYSLHTGPWSVLGADAAAVRQDVFLGEQAIDPSLEWDDEDASALHAVIRCAAVPVGTARLLTSREGTARIGRMAVLKMHRQQGLGSALLEALLAAAVQRGDVRAVLHAQCHAQAFYERAGFAICSPVFIEADIDHVEMQRRLRAA